MRDRQTDGRRQRKNYVIISTGTLTKMKTTNLFHDSRNKETEYYYDADVYVDVGMADHSGGGCGSP